MSHDVRLTVLANAFARWTNTTVDKALEELPDDVHEARQMVKEAERQALKL